MCTLVAVSALDILGSGTLDNHCIGTRCLKEIQFNSNALCSAEFYAKAALYS